MRRIGRKGREPKDVRSEEDTPAGNGQPKPSRTDIVAVIIALFQLILPLILGLFIVGVIVALILR
jgi:hypothetical protein